MQQFLMFQCVLEQPQLQMNLFNRFVFTCSNLVTHQPTNTIRLSKYLSLKSICSRREAQQFIKLGLVRVDGKRLFENMLVPAESNLKAFTPVGIQINKPITKLWMINKPRGYICTHRDPQKRKTIYQLFPTLLHNNFGYLMSVGRLDFNSQGLLLVTNDNTLKGLLENPQALLTRVYRVKVHGKLTDKKLQLMNSKITIKGKQYGPLNANMDRQLSSNSWLNVSIRTGKNREIRRIMQKCDLQVNKLIRTEYGPYKMGSLKHGEIAEMPISHGLQRKLKITKAKQLSNRLKGQGGCLIEVDIRDKAIGLAKEQLQIRHLGQRVKQINQTSPLLQQEEQQSSDDE